MANLQSYQARLYRPNSGQPVQVQLTLEDGQLTINSQDGQSAISLDDLELELAGHAEDRIKLRHITSGAILLCEDRQLINDLASHGQYPVCLAANKAYSKIRSAGLGGGLYWVKVSVATIAGIVFLYFALDWGVMAAFMNLNPDLESKLGGMLVEKEAKLAKTGTPAAARINRIGKKLVAQIKDNPYEFKFLVKSDPTLNACAYPGGTTFVNQGLIDKADDDELAAVMGHEIGHVIRRHSLRSMAHSLGLWTMLRLLCLGLGDRVDTEKIATAMNLGQKLEGLQFSRSQESEADKIGVGLAVNSGYRGDALMTFFKRLQANELTADNKMLAILSDHPMNTERIAAIEKELEQLKAEGKCITGTAGSVPSAPPRENH